MNNKKFDFCVFIGRFSIFHNAHLAIVQQALEDADKLIIVIGSSYAARSVRNPWTSEEREKMIHAALPQEQQDRLCFLHMRDYTYNTNMWLSVLQEKIKVITTLDLNDPKVALTGFESDETSYYLRLLPQWTRIPFIKKFDFHAAKLRDYYFSHDLAYKTCIPAGVISFLEQFKETPAFKYIKEEKDYIDAYKAQWLGSPFPPIFQTVDTLVLKSGHILVVERGRNPGKGLYAMPGGFLNPKERIEEAALRELREETSIKTHTSELRKTIIDQRVFDDPMRSDRGRVISHTFFLDLGTGDLPILKGADDARKAFWMPLSEVFLDESKWFEDHLHIIRSFINKY